MSGVEAMLLVACPIVAARLGEAILLEDRKMLIEGTKHTKVHVEVSAKELCDAVEQCREISLVRVANMLSVKMRAELRFNKDMYIDDGHWYLRRRDSRDDPRDPLRKHKASEAEIEIDDAIKALTSVLLVQILKK